MPESMIQVLGTRIKRGFNNALKEAGVTREEFAYRVLPLFLLDLIRRYLRVKTTGVKNLPRKGRAIVIANHSGFMGFDAAMLEHQVQVATGRLPKIIAHKMWLLRPEISVRASKLGLIPATFENAKDILEKNEMLLLFPEGEEGNFKPTRYRYQLRPFRRGFVRLALQTGAPIIPAIVIGAEETHINLGQIRWAKELIGIIIPVPLNMIPLPAKWQIRFLKPIRLPHAPEKVEDMKYVNKLTRQIRKELQSELDKALSQRKLIFLK